MKDEPNQLQPQSPAESTQTTAGGLLTLHDEADREAAQLRQLPSALGLTGLGLFLALFVFVLNAAELGVLASLGVSLLVASPGLILVARDLRRTQRLRLLRRMIEVAENQRTAQDGDVPHLSGGADAFEEGRSQEPG